MIRLTMFRFRRYKVFLITAFLITVALVRFSRNREWESSTPVGFEALHNGALVGHFDAAKDHSPPKSKASSLIPDVGHFAHSSEPSGASKPAVKEDIHPLKPSTKEDVPSPKSSVTSTDTSTNPKTVPKVVIPDRRPARLAGLHNEGKDNPEEIHMQPPGRVEPILFTPSPTPIYWVKQEEYFPVPTESIIQLPTGEAKSIPRIQYKFSSETEDAKNKREKRQQKVKDEFTRAWDGYRGNAWMHDELSPVSGGTQDPFGGWAATLIDSLDTLWIMGLEGEFEEAVRAVATIDFTTCARPDIPLFETTIRYLGGLLGAYDVSGHTYKTLLDKAVELAEVLMGAFDTPNRMPDLYYRWKPAFASQPHRASTRSNLAELGSLSMEFTRLAQLTEGSKYYDAVARITNALEEFQNRGTKLDGVFPGTVDASGCNRSAPVKHSLSTDDNEMILSHSLSAEGKGYEAPMPKVVKEPTPSKKKAVSQATDLELSVIPGEPSKGNLRPVEDGPDNTKGGAKLAKRTEFETTLSNSSLEFKQDATNNSVAARPSSVSQSQQDPDTLLGDWDCVPQGLDSASGSQGRDSFSMGGSQDSAYEYFSKVSCHCSRGDNLSADFLYSNTCSLEA
jgi:mannosyl-oligosaccharide alpha-1,2-mannosidase